LIIIIISLLLIGLGVYICSKKMNLKSELTLEEKYIEILKGDRTFYEVTEKSSDAKKDISMYKKDGSMYCHEINQICRLEFDENVFNYKPLIDHFEQELTEEELNNLLEEFNKKEELQFKTYKK